MRVIETSGFGWYQDMYKNNNNNNNNNNNIIIIIIKK